MIRGADLNNAPGDVASLCAAGTAAVGQDVKLEKLIRVTADSDVPVPVVDGNNKLVGTIDRKTIMLAMQTRD